jgi:hypothetical protein
MPQAFALSGTAVVRYIDSTDLRAHPDSRLY